MTRSSEEIVLACAANGRYVLPLAVMLQSAVTHLSPERRVAIYVLGGGIPRESRERLTSRWPPDRVSVRWIEPPGSALSGVPLWGGMPIETYYKLLLPELLPGSVHKAIWLDCDVVVKADLARLWDTMLEGRHALAVQDMLVPYVSSRFGIARHRELGLAPNAKYFNAGVMVVNLDLWRRDDVMGAALAYLRTHRESVCFMDQEGLNAVLAGRWGTLDPRWNQNAAVSGRSFFKANHLDRATYDRVVRDPWIVHFCGGLKPWIVHSANSPLSALFFEVLDRTAWAGWRPRKTLRARLLGLYESSPVRNLLYPVEKLRMQLRRKRTLESHVP